MTGVIALAIEYIAKDLYCLNITQADIIQTPYRLTREMRFSDYHTFRFIDAIFESPLCHYTLYTYQLDVASIWHSLKIQ